MHRVGVKRFSCYLPGLFFPAPVQSQNTLADRADTLRAAFLCHMDDYSQLNYSCTAATLYYCVIFIREYIPHVLEQKDVPRAQHDLVCS